MALTLTDERRAQLVANLQSLFQSEFDEALSSFRAEAILDALLTSLAPQIYNQAVQDVRAHLQTKLDDLDGDVHMPEDPA